MAVRSDTDAARDSEFSSAYKMAKLGKFSTTLVLISTKTLQYKFIDFQLI